MIGGLAKLHQPITKSRFVLAKAFYKRAMPLPIYLFLFLLVSLLLTSCDAPPAQDSLTAASIVDPIPSPIAAGAVAVDTIPPLVPTVPTLATTATPQPISRTLTLLPTATLTPTIEATLLPVAPTLTVTVTLPTLTPTPTLSLVDMLSQTVAVTATATLSATTPITHPEPPAVAQPALGPATPSSSPPWQPLAAATLTTLQPDGVARTAYIPILMYHYLSTPPANADIYRQDLSVPPALFAAQLDRIKSEGYTTISLYDLIAYLQQGKSLPEHPVILTFDDGYRDNYENAFPLLHERQMTATFFLVIDFINNERPEYLTWDMVREMYAGGMAIEVHGIDHSSLRKRSRADLEFQALRSYETIQDRIGIRPRFVSYPAGEYDADTITMFQSAGYWAALTTVQGATHNSDKLFELKRVRIRNTTTPDELVRLLAVDW